MNDVVSLSDVTIIIGEILCIMVIMLILSYCLDRGYVPILDDIDNFLIWYRGKRGK